MPDQPPSTTHYPRRSPAVAVRRIAAGSGLFDSAGEQLCFLNETAVALWELCDGETDPGEMVEAVRIVSGLSRELVKADIERALTELAELGVVEWSGRG